MKLVDLVEKIPRVDQGDRDFLLATLPRFERLEDRFREYLTASLDRRIPLALNALQSLPRTGWLRLLLDGENRDVLASHGREYYGLRWLPFEQALTGGESVLEHCAEAQELGILLFPEVSSRQMLAELMKFHDISEAIVGDFTPFDGLSREDKTRLELIALEVLTAGRFEGDLLGLHIYNCLGIYEGRDVDWSNISNLMLNSIASEREQGRVKSHQIRFVSFLENLYREDVDLFELRKIAKEIDVLHLVSKTSRIMLDGVSKHPDQELKRLCLEFFDWAESKIKTERGKAFYLGMRDVERGSEASYPKFLASVLIKTLSVPYER